MRSVVGSVLRPEIKDGDVVEDGSEDGAKGLVGGMRQVDGAVGLGLEGQDEAVGESLVVLLGAVVGAPLKRGDLGNLGLEGDEGGFGC